MSQPVTFAICGCGDRGLDAYAPYQHAHPEEMKIVAGAAAQQVLQGGVKPGIAQHVAHHHRPAGLVGLFLQGAALLQIGGDGLFQQDVRGKNLRRPAHGALRPVRVPLRQQRCGPPDGELGVPRRDELAEAGHQPEVAAAVAGELPALLVQVRGGAPRIAS